MKQWEKRIIILNNIYKFIITNSKKIENEKDADSEIIKILEYSFENVNNIKDIVKPYLNSGWTWDRILPIDQALIIMAYSEWKTISTDKAIIVDEVIKTAKNYSDINSYKFINYIVDKIINNA
ncbi:MAG: transcription antitermination factor NusB [Mycoplasmoidaceae bacterium]